MDYYFQIHQFDGRVENFHLKVNSVDFYLDFLNEFTGKAKSVETISEYEFLLKSNDVIKVDLHADLNISTGENEECAGYIEHYAVR